jgi:hypothetical protein
MDCSGERFRRPRFVREGFRKKFPFYEILGQLFDIKARVINEGWEKVAAHGAFPLIIFNTTRPLEAN